jgi:hypothetical protein
VMGLPITKAEQKAVRQAIRPAVKAHLAGSGQHYLKPSISIPGKGMKRLPNGAIQADVAISAMGFDWSPIPQRMVQETATFVKGARTKRVVKTAGWVQRLRSNPAGD